MIRHFSNLCQAAFIAVLVSACTPNYQENYYSLVGDAEYLAVENLGEESIGVEYLGGKIDGKNSYAVFANEEGLYYSDLSSVKNPKSISSARNYTLLKTEYNGTSYDKEISKAIISTERGILEYSFPFHGEPKVLLSPDDVINVHFVNVDFDDNKQEFIYANPNDSEEHTLGGIMSQWTVKPLYDTDDLNAKIYVGFSGTCPKDVIAWNKGVGTKYIHTAPANSTSIVFKESDYHEAYVLQSCLTADCAVWKYHDIPDFYERVGRNKYEELSDDDFHPTVLLKLGLNSRQDKPFFEPVVSTQFCGESIDFMPTDNFFYVMSDVYGMIYADYLFGDAPQDTPPADYYETQSNSSSSSWSREKNFPENKGFGSTVYNLYKTNPLKAKKEYPVNTHITSWIEVDEVRQDSDFKYRVKTSMPFKYDLYLHTNEEIFVDIDYPCYVAFSGDLSRIITPSDDDMVFHVINVHFIEAAKKSDTFDLVPYSPYR